MQTNKQDSILVRLRDLQNQALRTHRHLESHFLEEADLMLAQKEFQSDSLVRFDGGYEGARKKKVIFQSDEEDDFSDIVCLWSAVDQRFRTIGHRDVLGSLMGLQIDRNSFGDFWIEDKDIYIYTTNQMGDFLSTHLTSIGRHSVAFEKIEAHPIQQFQTKHLQLVIASNRIDAIVAALAHVSRAKAKEMIHNGFVQINHIPLVKVDEVCNNNCTISIRRVGRFIYLGTAHKTKKDRIVAEFEQFI
ncbi:MAG: RNA-binding protein [Solobacterium sp.]|nr:RNA-binding protein [Solobacterium sp.]